MRNRKLWIIAVIISLVAVSIYVPALDNNFVNWDDPVYVYDNPEMKAPDIDFVSWAFSTSRTGNWHPLTWLSLSIDYAFWEFNPAGYHLTSIILHGMNTLLVVLLAGSLFMKGMPSRKGPAMFGVSVVGIIFGLHPLHVESVAWISERKDVLYAFFWLLSLLAYIRFASSTILKQRAFYFLLCFISFALSLLSKPMAVMLPVVLSILDFYPLKRFDQKSGFIKVALLEKLPFYLLSFVVSFMTITAQKKEGAMGAMEYLSFWKRLVGALKAIGLYLAQTVWPVNMVPFYPLDYNISLLTWETMLSLIFVLSVTAVSLKLWRRIPLLITAWSYYLITLLPVLGIIQVGSQAMADRYMYLPIVGPLMVLGVLGAIAWGKGKYVRYLSVALLFFLSVVISAVTANQIPVWKDSVALWEYVISKKPGVALAHNNLGLAYNERGRTDDAVKEFITAIHLDPDHFKAHDNLGILYGRKGRTEDAIREFIKSLEINPGNFKAHNNLGLAYVEQGRTDDAVREFMTAIQLDPGNFRAHNNLAIAYIKQGRTDDAIRELMTVIRINPGHFKAHNNLGIIYGNEGCTEDAIKAFLRAIEINPDNFDVHFNLGLAYSKQGQTADAITAFLRAIEINPDIQEIHYNLGVAYKTQGRFDEAAREFQTTLDLNPDHAGAKKNLEIIRRMKQ